MPQLVRKNWRRLMRHPAVAMVGVVGVPDKVRTEIVKAFVQLRPEIVGTDSLKADLATFVKTRLAVHEYPREVEFVAELPLTTTGKIMRRELRRIDAERKGAARWRLCWEGGRDGGARWE